VGRETFDAVNRLLAAPELQAPPAGGVTYPDAPVGSSLQQAAQVVKARLGTRCIFVDVGGAFDTHANQLDGNAADYTNLGAALAAFSQDLGSQLDRVVVMVVTEFGRTAAQNGTLGTDHGSAHCMIFLGGRVRGGRVHGEWPGLSSSQLYEGRDLAVTTDFRDAFAEVAGSHLGIADAAALFPGHTPGPRPGVLR
jgi:uncharacterized protein (DUF1501 family)